MRDIVGRLRAMPAEERLYALFALPAHLAAGDRFEELCALLEDAGFRHEKLVVRGSVAELCSDLDLTFRAALDRADVARAGRFGFLYAGYREGRRAALDPEVLLDRDLNAALPEVRLLHPGPRLRLLVLLALREAEAGRDGARDELIAEAASLRDVDLTGRDAAFLGCCVARLLASGGRRAPELLRAALPSAALAAAQAARAARLLAPADQVPLLTAAVEWLRETTDLATQVDSRAALAAFEAVCEAVARLPAGAAGEAREELVRRLTEVSERTQTIKEAAGAPGSLMDVLPWLAVLLVGEEATTALDDPRVKRRAILGAALARADPASPAARDLLAQAVAACGPDAFAANGEVARCLRDVPAPLSTELLLSLLERVAGNANELAEVLEPLAAPGDRPQHEAVLLRARSLVFSLSADKTVRSRLYRHLALAEAAAGLAGRARADAGLALMPFDQLAFVLSSPLQRLSPELLDLVCGSLELLARTGQRDPAWILSRLRKLAKRVGGMEVLGRRKVIERYLDLCDRIGSAEGVRAWVALAARGEDLDRRAEELETILDRGSELAGGIRARARRAVLAALPGLADEDLRCRLAGRWLETAGEADAEMEPAVLSLVESVSRPELAAGVEAALAGWLAALGRAAEAEDRWCRAAVHDQESRSRPDLLASGIIAAARSPRSSDWQAVLDALRGPDVVSSCRIAELAADGCEQPERLAELVGRVAGFAESSRWQRNLAATELALARAWTRLGEPGRAAARGAAALAAFRRSWDRQTGDFEALLETFSALQGDRRGRALLLRLVPLAIRHPDAGLTRCLELARRFARLRDDAFARRSLRLLLTSVLDDVPLSRWTHVQVMAEIALGLARRGHLGTARHLAHWIPRPGDDGSPLVAPDARWKGLLALAEAFAEIHAADPAPRDAAVARGLLEEARGALGESVSASHLPAARVALWRIARRLGEAGAGAWLEEAEAAARSHAEHERLGGDRFLGWRELALAWAGFGDFTAAVAAARRITEEEERDALLVRLAARAWDRAPDMLQAVWREIATAEARRSAAREIARRAFVPDPELPAVRPPGADAVWLHPERHRRFASLGLVLAVILGLAAAAGVYAGLWLAWPSVRQGLAGPSRPLWVLGLAAAAGVALVQTRKGAREINKQRTPKWWTTLLLLPLAPLLWAARSVELAHRSFPDARAWAAALLENTFHSGSTGPVPGRRPSTAQLACYSSLLRESADDSESFDALYAAWLCWSGARIEPEDPLWLPQARAAPPEATRRLLRRDASDRWWRIRSPLGRAAAAAGKWLTAGVLFLLGLRGWLALSLRGWRERRLGRRAEKYSLAEDRRALPLLEKLVVLDPGNFGYWNDYANAKARQRELADAVEAYRKALDLARGDPREFQLWYNLGRTFWQTRRYEEGLAAFERVLALAPRDDYYAHEAAKGRQYCLDGLRAGVASIPMGGKVPPVYGPTADSENG